MNPSDFISGGQKELSRTNVVADQPNIAGYIVTGSLATGSNGEMLLATRVATSSQVVLKLFRPTILVDGVAEREARDRRISAFLVTAQIQKEVATTVKRWAPIYSFGPLPDGAYYATDVYPASVEWLIRAHVTVNGSTLRRIISGVIEALDELSACRDRGHGNLTPANVLLNDRNPRLAQVVLTDPSLNADPDSRVDGQDDRWALGALIYSLVTHTQVRRMMQLPIDVDASWLALGHDGRRWLSLCNRLLSHDATQRPDLVEVAKELESKVAYTATPLVRRVALAGASFPVLGALLMGAYSIAYRQIYARQLSVAPEPVQSLVANRGDPGFRDAIATDGWLAPRLPGLLDEVAKLEDEGRHLPLVPSPSKFLASRHAGEAVSSVSGMFDDRKWPTLQEIQNLRDLSQKNGWAKVLAPLNDVTNGLPPGGGAEAAQHLQNFLAKAPNLLKRGAAITSAWDSFIVIVAPSIEAPNMSVQAVARALQAHVAMTVNLDVAPDLSKAMDAAKKLADFAASPSVLNYKPTCESIRTAFNGTLPAELDVPVAALLPRTKWEVAKVPVVESTAVVKTEVEKPDIAGRSVGSSKAFDGVAAGLSDAKALLDKREENSNKLAFDERYEQLINRAQALSKQTWTAGQAADFDAQCGIVQIQINALTHDLRVDRVDSWLAAVSSQSQVYVPDHTSWQTALDALARDVSKMADDPVLLKSRQDKIADWLAFLPHLDRGIRAAASLPPDYAGAIQDQRVSEWWLSIPRLDLDKPMPPVESLICATPQTPWSTELGKFALDFPMKRPAVDLRIDDLRKRWVGSHANANDAQFWQQEVISADGSLHSLSWMARDVETINALAATSRMTRNELIAAVRENKSPDLLMFARLRLDALGGDDVWPRSAGDLKLAVEWFTRIKGCAESLGMSAADVNRLVARQRQAWKNFVVNASSATDIEQAWGEAKLLGVKLDSGSDDLFAVLPDHPPACYNILIYLARQPKGGDFKPGLMRAINQLPPEDNALVAAALKKVSADPSTDQLRTAINDDSWYRWPSAKFAPVPILPPAPAVATAVPPLGDPKTNQADGEQTAKANDSNAQPEQHKRHVNSDPRNGHP